MDTEQQVSENGEAGIRCMNTMETWLFIQSITLRLCKMRFLLHFYVFLLRDQLICSMSLDVSFPLYSSVSLPATGPKVNQLLCQKAIVPRAVVLLRANQPPFKDWCLRCLLLPRLLQMALGCRFPTSLFATLFCQKKDFVLTLRLHGVECELGKLKAKG